MKKIRLASMIILALGASLHSGCSNGDDAKAAHPKLAVFVADDQLADRCTIQRVMPDGSTVFMSDTPILTERDVAETHFGDFIDGLPVLTLEMTNVGIRTLTDRADEYVNRKFVIIWDGEPVSAPNIKNPLSSQIAVVASPWVRATLLQEIDEHLMRKAAK